MDEDLDLGAAALADVGDILLGQLPGQNDPAGPQGLGGTVTALSCAIEPFGTHIAGLPCVVNISCHVTRHAEGEI